MPWSHKLAKGAVEGMYLPAFKFTWPLSSLVSIEPEPSASILKATAVRTEKPVTAEALPKPKQRKEGNRLCVLILSLWNQVL